MAMVEVCCSLLYYSYGELELADCPGRQGKCGRLLAGRRGGAGDRRDSR